MELSKSQLEYVYAQNWDPDVRQEALLRALEYNGKVEFFKTWISTIYNNLLQSTSVKATRRGEIVEDNKQRVADMFNRHDNHDPILDVERDELLASVDDLSDTVKDTLLYLTTDRSIEEYAEKEGVAANTIYQRIYQAKKELQDAE